MSVHTKNYREVAQEKAESLINNIPSEWRLQSIPDIDKVPNASEYADTVLAEAELEIVNSSATALLRKLSAGKLTALEVTNAYCHRASIIHQLTNCCSEIFFDLAVETAKKLDEYYQKNGKLIGKLHGIPVSLKDQVNLPGIDTAIGYLGPYRSFEIQQQITHRKSHQDESLIATLLKQEGAVFYVKTHVPMAMLAGETSSNYGITLNALDRRLSPGGSSGGEGALIGGKGSVIGLGTDIGGSIRIPSSVHGIYGLRGCSNRFPYLDIANSYPNQTCIPSVVGPMCRFVEDLSLISEAILNHPLCQRDPKWVPIPWRSDLYEQTKSKDLKVGILKWDGEILPQPPILNKINHLNDVLTENHIQTKQLELKPEIYFSKLTNILLGFYTCDGFEEINKFCKLGGEPLSDLFLRSFDHKKVNMNSLNEFMDRVGDKYAVQQLFDAWWRENSDGEEELDCIILPSYSAPNWVIGEQKFITNGYTRSINVLDYTAITLPVGKVTEDDKTWPRDDFATEQDKSVWNYYDQSKMLGKPVCLQVICKRYQEEKIIAICERLSKLIN